MKQLRILSFLMALTTMALFMSCGDDDDNTIEIDTDLEIAFDETSATVAENGSAVTATISFPEAPTAITVMASVSGTATYDEDYTSSPAVSNDEVSLSIAEGDTEATITLTPMDNDEVDGSRDIVLTLQAADGLELGSNTTYTVTITDNETPKTIVNFNDLRDRYEGTEIELTDEEYIQGTVVSSNDNVTSKNVFIQDDTGGMVVRFEEDNTLSFGDEVEINIMGGTLSDFNDLVQVNELPNANATVISSGNTVTPETITISQMNTGDYEAQYVSIENVTFPDADGSSEDLNGNNTIEDGTEGVLRVESYASFSGDIEPLGTGTVTGVVGVYQGTYQLIPQESDDIFANNPSAFIDVTQSISAFAATANGSVSSEQNFTVEGTGVSGNITITASDYFEVASPNAVTRQGGVALSYSSSIDVPGTGAQTIYVRFAPASGTNGTKTGTIEASATGAVTESFSVEGEESGNVNEAFFTEDFETDGNGTRYTTSVVESISDFDFFGRTDGSDLNAAEFEYDDANGYFFALHDSDGVSESADGATLTFSNIDISGKSNLLFSVFVAEDDDGSNNDWDDSDNVHFTYSIDGGNTNNLLWLENDGSEFNSPPFVDTNFDGTGEGTEVTSTFSKFTASIPETGSSLTITVTFNGLTSNDEDIAIDNIALVED